MIKGFFYVFFREIRILFKDKKSFAVLLFVPILYTLVFGYMYQANMVKHVKTAVINYSPSNISRMVTNGFEKSDRFDIKYYLNDEGKIKSLMENDEIDVAVIIPRDFTKNIKNGKASSVFLGIDTSNVAISNGAMASAMQIVQTYSKGTVIKKLEATGLLAEEASSKAMPISVSFHPWYNPSFGYTNFILLGVMAVALQQITLMFAANSLTREIERNELNELLKYNPIAMYIGKFIVYLLAGLFTLIGGCLVAFKIFHVPLQSEAVYILLLAVPFYISIISFGFFIAIFCKNQGESAQIAMLLAYPTFLLSGFTWPLASMPETLQMVSKALPLTYFASNIRKISLMELNFEALKNELYSLCALSCIYFVISLIVVVFKYKASNSSKEAASLEGKKVQEC
ncbi:ABC-2 type transport system permease protein [Desulfonispora thiosulfatigenes DSM 11270]|uniref:ABC-2 type transport system permease protein n=1 Tax=Desulfonispora thiosulfatigenes DSM 11270 TaxID=656914 RepID=A0A1W1UU91_DESTI|nr:ABC transporter permease [Desulfonispora thiosulfatigenes]SMB84667.1 ABC-2 type transport system permease protein [Desulfonispora thiosulfatigenes DSM 11270]